MIARIQGLEPAPVRDSHLTMSAIQIADIDGQSVYFDCAVGPYDFFNDLRRDETPSGTKFMKDANETTVFPDRLSIRVIASLPTILTKKKDKPTVVNPDFMKDLQFAAQWKHGMDLRPVKKLRLLTASESNFPGRGDVWNYYLVLDDSEVPLDDHLILDVLAPDKKRIARLAILLRETTVKRR